MRCCVIFNPSARGGKASALARAARTTAFPVEWRPTPGPGSAPEMARIAVREGFDVIVAAGGDGTVFEVLNGLASEPGGLDRTRLAVVPMGTANVLAHELGLPMDPRRALEVVPRGRARVVDLAQAEFLDDAGQRRTAHFAVVAGAGLDARAVHGVDLGWKSRVGKLAYIAAALQAARQPSDRVRCRLGGREFEGRAVLVGNGRLYAGAIPVFGEGSLESGQLEVRGVRRITPTLLARCAWAYLTGRWTPGREIVADAAAGLDLESEGPAPLQLDGEWVGWLPARIRILPRRLQVVAP